MGDLIDRQDAIDAIESLWDWNTVDGIQTSTALRQVIHDIKDLPSAQPDTDEWCTDCKEYDQKKHCCPRFNRVIRQTLETQIERKKGFWINRSLNIVYPEWEDCTCSVCGKHSHNYDFCPNCGADMRGEG